MSRILVVFASTHGQTRDIATALAVRLRSCGHTVDLADAEAAPAPPPAGYDAVLLGSRIQLDRHAASIVRYLRAHRDALAAMPTGFFSVSMSAAQAGAGDDPKGYLATLFAKTGWTPTHAVAFAGALRYRRYGWLIRFIMKQISRRGGHATDTSRDHVYTSWQAVDRFATTFAAGLPGVTAAPAADHALATPPISSSASTASTAPASSPAGATTSGRSGAS